MRTLALTLLLLPAFLLLAPSPAAAQQPDLETSSAPTHWRLSEEPVLVLGSAFGAEEYQWGSVAGTTRLSSGHVVVVDVLNREISWYDQEGRHVVTSGREGQGPEEFVGMMAPMRCAADSTFVWDSGLGRVTVFGPQGSYARDFRQSRVRPADPERAGWPLDRMTCNPDGVFAATSQRMADFSRTEGPLGVRVRVEVAREGGGGRVIGSFRGDDRFVLQDQIFPQPLGRKTRVALGSDRLYVGTAETFEVRVFSLEGEPLGVVRDDVPPVPITDEVVEAFVARYPEDRRGFWAKLEYPDVLPAYSALLVDAGENLWIREHWRPGREGERWRVYDRDGALRAVVTLPPGFDLHEVGSDYVLGVTRDELDVQYVQLHTLLKDGS